MRVQNRSTWFPVHGEKLSLALWSRHWCDGGIKETLPHYTGGAWLLSDSHSHSNRVSVELLIFLCDCFSLPSCTPIIFQYYY